MVKIRQRVVVEIFWTCIEDGFEQLDIMYQNLMRLKFQAIFRMLVKIWKMYQLINLRQNETIDF